MEHNTNSLEERIFVFHNFSRYTIHSWVDQAIQFIEQVVLPEHAANTKVHLVGNSVGGHLAVFLAALRPDLVESVCLLNATPVWGLNLPGWSGSLPAPAVPRAIGRYLFDRMRDLNTIRAFLDNSYSRREAFDETLVRKLMVVEFCVWIFLVSGSALLTFFCFVFVFGYRINRRCNKFGNARMEQVDMQRLHLSCGHHPSTQNRYVMIRCLLIRNTVHE